MQSLKDPQEFQNAVRNQFSALDVVSAQLGGHVIGYSDAWFCPPENLLKSCPPVRDATRFTSAGAWYDGWETRRHNPQEYDWVIIELGVPRAQIAGCEVDTAFFNGNHAPYIGVDAIVASDGASPAEDDPRWEIAIAKSECGPSQRHFWLRSAGLTATAYTHVKLKMFPDGGIARFRLYGRVIGPPISDSCIDLAYAGNGGIAISCSDEHFSPANNLLLPGRGYDMSDGWETKRSREPAHEDWVIVQLSRESKYLEKIVIDTAHYIGNYPQHVSVKIHRDVVREELNNSTHWMQIVPKSKAYANKEHVFDIGLSVNVRFVKLTIFPDGGVKRLRVIGK